MGRWEKDLYNTEKYPLLRTYRLFKSEFKMSAHLVNVRNPSYRNAINKIICSSHLLNIERGRHTNPKTPLEQRKCINCNCIEDEIHFIIVCDLYTSERKLLFENVNSVFSHFRDMSSIEKFVFLFQCNDANVLSWLGKFIISSFETHNNKLKTL